MSRVAKAPVELPSGVEFSQSGSTVTMKGGKGTLTLELNSEVELKQEENKLIACYGEQYDKYRRSVPGLFPLPWRHLSKQDAQAILGMGEKRDRSGSQ